MNGIEEGDIIKVKAAALTSELAGEYYNEEDRFEVITIDELYKAVLTRRVGYSGANCDFFPIYMIERA